MTRRGFTLVEMLVVIGVLALLMGIATGGYALVLKSAQRTRCTELVSNVKTALESVLQDEDGWPPQILRAGSGAGGLMDALVGASLARRNALSLTYHATMRDGQKAYVLTGVDQLGIVDPWAQAVIKNRLGNGTVSRSTPVPEGGTIEDHTLRFVIDDDYDGICNVPVSVSGGASAKVRASACVWAYGRDGKLGTKDDVYSWTPGQEVQQ